MKLAHEAQVRIDLSKVADYLLSDSHPDGRAKAAFFRRFGFEREHPDVLADALRKHAATHEVAGSVDSPFGARYTVEGALDAPDGRRPVIRSVWVVEKGTDEARLVTAYPA